MKTIPKTYSELAKILINKKEIKVNTFYGTNYSEYAVYIPRIYHQNRHKAKVRILNPGDNVKNCLKITFNPERYDKKDIEFLINSNVKTIKNFLQGSCQSFLTISKLNQILTGLVGTNGIHKPEVREMLNKEY